jgi:hypothetical protein
MITLRESEIRNESLSLAVDAYQFLSLLPLSLNAKVRSQIIDDSFQVSSFIAEAFQALNNEQATVAIASAIERLNTLKLLLEQLSPSNQTSGLISSFQHRLEEMYVELTELLSALNQINADTYSAKLDTACI